MWLKSVNNFETSRAGFYWWGPGANIEDGSSLIIGAVDHIKDQRTGLINTTYPSGGGPGPWPPGPPKSDHGEINHRQTDVCQ